MLTRAKRVCFTRAVEAAVFVVLQALVIEYWAPALISADNNMSVASGFLLVIIDAIVSIYLSLIFIRRLKRRLS
jgi:hypothetical protein